MKNGFVRCGTGIDFSCHRQLRPRARRPDADVAAGSALENQRDTINTSICKLCCSNVKSPKLHNAVIINPPLHKGVGAVCLKGLKRLSVNRSYYM